MFLLSRYQGLLMSNMFLLSRYQGPSCSNTIELVGFCHCPAAGTKNQALTGHSWCIHPHLTTPSASITPATNDRRRINLYTYVSFTERLGEVTTMWEYLLFATH